MMGDEQQLLREGLQQLVQVCSLLVWRTHHRRQRQLQGTVCLLLHREDLLVRRQNESVTTQKSLQSLEPDLPLLDQVFG